MNLVWGEQRKKLPQKGEERGLTRGGGKGWRRRSFSQKNRGIEMNGEKAALSEKKKKDILYEPDDFQVSRNSFEVGGRQLYQL